MNILIVDDDSTNRKLLRATLGADGYETIEACDGLEALEVLGTDKIDAVISDVLMPNMDGYRLCAEVRRRENGRSVPFIIYTSTYTDSSDEKIALGFGADRYVRKPAPAGAMTQTIEELVIERQYAEPKRAPAGEEHDVMKHYSQALVRKLEKRNDELSARTAALHASETRLRTIFEAEPDCVQVVGRDGKMAEINPAGLEMFEADSLEQLAECSMAQFVTEEHLEAFNACVEAVWRGEKRCAEFEIIGLQGKRRWLEMHAAPMRDPQGEIVALLGIARDNTARKELEAQFVQAQKMEVVGHLAGGIAHDFNNMLGIIMGYSEIAMSDLSSGSPLHEHVQTIFHTAERAAALTRQLLIFSRKETAQPQVLDLSEVITGVDPMLRRLIGENIKLVTTPETDLGQIEADPGQIEQVVMNLTVNARDAMPEGGKITIATRNATLAGNEIAGPEMTPGDYVVLSVADNGTGMSEAVKARIFEAFFTTKSAGNGTGLGLATCQSIVKRWRGHITVESELGIGTKFEVYLPAGDRVCGGGCRFRPERTAPPRHGDDPAGGGRSWTPRTHCIHPAEARLFRPQGWEWAGGAADRAHRPGLLDRSCGDRYRHAGDGRKMMAEWLQATNPEIKILFTSGYTDCGLDGALDAGIEFLQKPYTPSTLVRKVRDVIERDVTTVSDSTGIIGK